METPSNNKEFEVTGVSRSGRIRKKSSKLLDFQSPDESIQRKMYKRSSGSSSSRSAARNGGGRGRPSLATLKARKQPRTSGGQQAVAGDPDDVAEDDDDMDNENELDDKMDSTQPMHSDDDDNIGDDDDVVDDDLDDDEHLDDVLANNATESDDDGFGELVADLVGTEGGGAAAMERGAQKSDSNVRKSLYMSEKRSGKDGGRLERKDKGKSRYTAYSLWAREYRKTANFGKEVDFTTARRELWANVSNKEKNNWRRKAKIQATKAKAMERSGGAARDKAKLESSPTASGANSTFINRPTTSRTKKLQLQAEEKQKAKESMETKVSNQTPTSRRTRNNSYNRKSTTAAAAAAGGSSNKNSNTVALYANGSSSNYDLMAGSSSLYNSNSTPLPTIEPIDAAAHLKLLGESLTIIGERLKDHEGQIAVSGSLSVLLDSLLCSLGPLLCLTTCLPGLEKKTKLKTNLAVTLDNIAYVMPGL
ncbi:HMG box-containing protein 4 [Musca vetustissima]|uniref:HMG box-containing protein 4 n=1 Tax=Musca vetustissima TaxID=27455 RepID=UPI002AB709D0|nr:HMG box-containing protein 4 [Musca vetustissima]